jgi:hypothetical protein
MCARLGDVKLSVILWRLATLAAIVSPTHLSGEVILADVSEVTFEVRRYEFEERGLRVSFRLSNKSSHDICLFAPPAVSTVAGLFDRKSGYFVRDFLEDDTPIRTPDSEALDSQRGEKTVVISSSRLDFDIVIRPMMEPVLVDVSNVPVEGEIHKEALLIVSDVTLTDCEFDQPDEAMRAQRFQTLKAKSYKLTGDLKALFPG